MRLLSLLILCVVLALGACAPSSRRAAPVNPPPDSPASSSRVLEGRASWYGPNFAGKRTANGEIFDPSHLTAAHQTLPFGTQVRVTNLNNGRSVVVRINDRGPFVGRRIIDLSRRAAERIDMIGTGTAPVRLEILNDLSGAPISFRTGVDQTLQGYSVVSADHKLGTLLLLSSDAVSRPLLVRVVKNDIPEGVDMMVSQALYAELGGEINVVTP